MKIKQRERGIKSRLSTEINRVQSVWDKIADIDMLSDGKVQSNYLIQKMSLEEKSSYRKFVFESLTDFEKWK